MAFTDDEIHAVVRTAKYSQAAEDWITATLIERRNRTGRAFYSRVLPLDHFHLSAGTYLSFDDLAVTAGFAAPRDVHDRMARVRQRARRADHQTRDRAGRARVDSGALPSGRTSRRASMPATRP